jgi:4-amino-4-deoxy-L-arabinose transferase-like glycosyltransferase
MTLFSSETRIFWLFAVMQGVLWTLVPTLVFQNLPMDVIEGLAWGHAWPIGTYKHPPLQAWLLESTATLTGHTDMGIYALSALCLVITYWAVWQLGKMVLAPASALIGTMALVSCFYFSTTIPEFNPNVVQMPLYALCGLFFWRAYWDNRWYDWLVLGICAGLGLWGKYSFILMLLSIGLFIVSDPYVRRIRHNFGAWLALTVAAVIFLPHAIWLLSYDWLPLAYARSRTLSAESIWQALWWALLFMLNQLLVISPVVLVTWLARQPFYQICPARRYLTFLAWGPFVLMTVLALALEDRPRDMWGMAMWPFIGLWCATLWNSGWERWAQRVCMLAMLVMPLCIIGGSLWGVQNGYSPWRTSFQGRALAQAADALWQKHHPDVPLTVVLGDNWLGGNISWYGRDRPFVMPDGDVKKSAWITPEMIKAHGALAVWNMKSYGENVPEWALRHGVALVTQTIRIPYGTEMMSIGLAVITPK